MGICIGAAFVSMMLRVYVKLAVKHMWGWDDCESLEIFTCIMLMTVWACLKGFVSKYFVCPSQLL